jgi:hypothetical protein
LGAFNSNGFNSQVSPKRHVGDVNAPTSDADFASSFGGKVSNQGITRNLTKRCGWERDFQGTNVLRRTIIELISQLGEGK